MSRAGQRQQQGTAGSRNTGNKTIDDQPFDHITKHIVETTSVRWTKSAPETKGGVLDHDSIKLMTGHAM